MAIDFYESIECMIVLLRINELNDFNDLNIKGATLKLHVLVPISMKFLEYCTR